MKERNNKGFTLIELLAVIVILAIVLTITIPSVIKSINTAREDSLDNAANSVAEWFEKNYELASLNGMGDPAPAYTAFALTAENVGTEATSVTPKELTEAVLKAAGISNPSSNLDLEKSGGNTVFYNTATNRMCITLTAKSGGSFDSNDSAKNIKKSSGC